MRRWQLISLNEPHSTLWNMACDEFLLESRPAMPTLRFYRWSEPSVSIGYFQNMDIVKSRFASRKHLTLVRRITGGGAVDHEGDLTFSLVIPVDNPFFSRNAREFYHDFHRVLLEALRQDFPELKWSREDRFLHPRAQSLCFEDPVTYDLNLAGHKALGSSQRRRGGYVLSQSSFVLPLKDVLLAEHVKRAFVGKLQIEFVEKKFDESELNGVNLLVKNKYETEKFSSSLTG